EMHVGIGVGLDVTRAGYAARTNQHVLGLAPVSAAIHAQRAADRAWNAAIERKPRDAGLLRGFRDAQVGHCGPGTDAMIRLDLRLVEAAPEADHDTLDTSVTHD